MQAEDQVQVFHNGQPRVVATNKMEVSGSAKQGLVAEQRSQAPAGPTAALSRGDSGEQEQNRPQSPDRKVVHGGSHRANESGRNSNGA